MAPFEWDELGGVLHRVECLSSGRVVDISLKSDEGGLRVEVRGRLSKAESREITAKANWMFMLGADFREFYARAEAEPRLAHCRAGAHGRFLRSPALYEDIVKVMLTTNIRWSGTRRLVA